MGSRVFGAFGTFYACFCLFVVLLQIADSQRNPGAQPRNDQRGAFRQALQWSHNGKVFSLLSQGSEYVPPKRRGATQEQEQARPVTIIRDADVRQQDARSQPQQQQPPRSLLTIVRGHEHRQHLHRERPAERTVAQGTPKVNGTLKNVNVSQPLPRVSDMMLGDDPYDPYKSIDFDNPYYNHYDVYERPRSRSRPGYGTRYHQYGKNKRKTLSE